MVLFSGRILARFGTRATLTVSVAAISVRLALYGLFPFLGGLARSELGASAYHIALLNTAGSVGNLFNPLMAHHIRNRAKLPYAVWPIAIGRAFFLLMALALSAPVFIGLSFLANADSAGLVLGARVPIILTSRADSVRSRIASCGVAVLAAYARRHGGVRS